MKRARQARPQTKPPTIELRIRLDLPGVGQIGPGKIELLRQIRAHRSISAAARAMNMSYRRAWLLVQNLNELFAEPVVEKWLGGTTRGGASLTPAGTRLISSYETVLARSAEVNRVLLDEILRGVQAPGARSAAGSQ